MDIEKISFGITDQNKILGTYSANESRSVIHASIKNRKGNHPIIPEFVAKYVDVFNSKYSMLGIELLTFKDKDVPKNVEKWLTKNQDNSIKFIEAVLYGYEVLL